MLALTTNKHEPIHLFTQDHHIILYVETKNSVPIRLQADADVLILRDEVLRRRVKEMNATSKDVSRKAKVNYLWPDAPDSFYHYMKET